MKRTRNFIMLIVYLIAFITVAIACNSCSLVMLPETTNYTQDSPVYTKWKAEQAQILQNQLNYVNSEEFKRKYEGTSLANDLPGARANSVVGTKDDPLKDVRNMNSTPDYKQFDVRISTGNSFNSSTMYYNIQKR